MISDRPLSTAHRALRSYFRSGWAFLIPYLAAYLLYAWLRLPVNPVDGGQSAVSAIGAIPSTDLLSTVTPSTAHSILSTGVPCLLHVYWLLHSIHLILGALALRSWWRASGATVAGATDDSENTAARAAPPQPLVSTKPREGGSTVSLSDNRLLSTAYSLLPWILLALLFYIPGVYLEWPSDSWEHLRRINEWHILDQVTAHSSWKKSSYFLPYSLTGHTTGLDQLSWLNLYYTGACLLLSWQYYRLARACDLSERASMMFVLLQALLFGNNIFSFYRYYGLSSSIFAQIGAVALTRIALEALRPREGHGVRSREHEIVHDATPSQSKKPALSLSMGYSLLTTRYPLLQLASAGIFLLPLIAFNHIQGLGIVGLGILAVVVWRLIEWRRSIIVWLILLTIVLSVAAVLWIPRHPAIDGVYRPQGWLTGWYGFNLFLFTSPAFEKFSQILGIFGMMNFAIGLCLLRRNHIVGWLTIISALALVLPCFALPLTQLLASGGGTNSIIVFHRMFFVLPTGLALAAVIDIWTRNSTGVNECRMVIDKSASQRTYPSFIRTVLASPKIRSLSLTCALPLALTLLCIEALSHHRFWQGLQVTPADLQLRSLVAYSTLNTITQIPDEDTLRIDIQLGTEVQEAFSPKVMLFGSRQSHIQLDDKKLGQFLEWLTAMQPAVSWVRAKGSGNETPRYIQNHSPARRDHPVPHARIVAHPTATDAAWLTFGGHPPEQIFANGQLALASPVGRASETFNPELIPVSRDRRYRVSSTIRHVGDPEAVNYPAVAWFDQSGTLLPSNASPPSGAGEPQGWANGNFSYYGLRGQSARPQKTNYSISFGLGEAAAIPSNAAFVRVGALLNYHSTPETMAELSHVTLAEKPLQSQLLFRVPEFRQLYSPASQAALLSGHWSAQHVSAAQAGAMELHTGLHCLIKW